MTIKDNDLLDSVRFIGSREKCARSRGLEGCKDCKETLEKIIACREWKNHRSAFEKLKEALNKRLSSIMALAVALYFFYIGIFLNPSLAFALFDLVFGYICIVLFFVCEGLRERGKI